MELVIWHQLDPAQRAFWQAFVLRIASAHKTVHDFRSGGQGLRMTAFVASAAVPVLAVFQGTTARLVIAAVGAIAVVFNGAALIFRVDGRVSINRRYLADLLDAGWRLAGDPPSATGATLDPSETLSARFETFTIDVTTLHKAYTNDYAKQVDNAPAPQVQ